MQRSQLIRLHLYVASSLVPFLFIMSLSGVLKLAGVKGEVYKELIFSARKDVINFKSATIKQDVQKMLVKINANPDFDHVKIKKNTLYTRPNYTTYYVFKKTGDYLKIYEYTPSMQHKLMSLHKGNGPRLYQLYQQVFVYGLFFVLLSGLGLGLTSPALRSKTIIVFLAGTIFYLILINY